MATGKSNRPVEVVNFSRYKKATSKEKSKNGQPMKTRNHESELKDQEAQMKKFRHDVFKFAISGLDRAKKTEAKEALLIKLGAKPRKPKAINYRDLMSQKKEEKKQKEEERKRNDKSGIKKPIKSKNEKQKKRDTNEVKGFDYQVGKFKGGVLYVNKKNFVKR
ncbi:uncharacterized protein C1orf131-like [Panonychus citri]|uniref:uncharacterized protein C1orf131-like n=1 Tax=Panonychus citri TaxID=50023 RepID=UPI00230828DB|nr:uncharacterized protein C1orf131-like [Panonychus citri]